jgi:hypothetical protein
LDSSLVQLKEEKYIFLLFHRAMILLSSKVTNQNVLQFLIRKPETFSFPHPGEKPLKAEVKRYRKNKGEKVQAAKLRRYKAA